MSIKSNFYQFNKKVGSEDFSPQKLMRTKVLTTNEDIIMRWQRCVRTVL